MKIKVEYWAAWAAGMRKWVQPCTPQLRGVQPICTLRGCTGSRIADMHATTAPSVVGRDVASGRLSPIQARWHVASCRTCCSGFSHALCMAWHNDACLSHGRMFAVMIALHVIDMSWCLWLFLSCSRCIPHASILCALDLALKLYLPPRRCASVLHYIG